MNRPENPLSQAYRAKAALCSEISPATLAVCAGATMETSLTPNNGMTRCCGSHQWRQDNSLKYNRPPRISQFFQPR